MRWQKRGLVYAPSGDLWWAKSHAYLPTADVVDGKRIRVYFASLDDKQFGRVGYVELDIANPSVVLFLTKEPILDLGRLGTFDDSGVTPSCIMDVQGKKNLYYIGWQRAERVPYMLFSGLAVSDDGGRNFNRYSTVPVLDRTATEPYTRSAPIVIKDNGLLRMWYVCARDWIEIGGKLYPTYVVKLAESQNGTSWQTREPICIDFKSDDEFGFGRPWVIKDGPIYRMWYSIRSKIKPYYIGYAESADGLYWNRKDSEAGIQASETGWDSEMICFPCVLDVAGKRYMFYNGNRHGETGFGYAVLEA